MITTIPIAVYHSAYGKFCDNQQGCFIVCSCSLFLWSQQQGWPVSSTSQSRPKKLRQCCLMGKTWAGGGALGEGWQVLVLNLLRGTQLPPGTRVPVQADVIRLGRYCPLGKKEKQMFSQYVTRQDQFSLGLAWRTRNHLCQPLEPEACTQMEE